MIRILEPPSTCIDFKTVTGITCLPIREDCNTTVDNSGLVVECGMEWNCNLCPVDHPYFVPFVRCDKFMIQTLFVDNFNSDRETPTSGVSNRGSNSFVEVELCHEGGNISLTGFTSRTMAGWSGSKSYQIIEVDTADVPACFQIKYYVNNKNGEIKEFCTQHFQEKRCQDTIVIYSHLLNEDCRGNYYGEAEYFIGDEIIYTNERRFRGTVICGDGSKTKSAFGNIQDTTTTTINSEVIFKLMACYEQDIILKELLEGDPIYVGTKKYNGDCNPIYNVRAYDASNVNFSNAIAYNNMFQGELTLSEICENSSSFLDKC